MSNNRPAFNLNPGDVAYYIRLHLDTLRYLGDHPENRDDRMYEVAGKARPMIVIKVISTDRSGRSKYQTVSLTSKGRDWNGDLRPGFVRLGDLLQNGTESFVKLSVDETPDNLIQPPGKLKALDQLSFNAIISILQKTMISSKT